MPTSRVTYREIMRRLLHQIESGELRVGDRLPSERELSESTGAAVATVHRAMSELAKLGVTEGVRGAGHVVLRAEPVEASPQELAGGGHLREARRSLAVAREAGAAEVEIARVSALISIAESLDVIARRS